MLCMPMVGAYFGKTENGGFRMRVTLDFFDRLTQKVGGLGDDEDDCP